MTGMPVQAVLSCAVAFLPVLLFLAALQFLDSYKLVPPLRILTAILAGAVAAGIGYSVTW